MAEQAYEPRLKTEYRQNAAFFMNRKTQGIIRKFKDTTGNYLWQPSLQAGAPSQLLGYPVTEMAAMPTPAAAPWAAAACPRRGKAAGGTISVCTA